MNISLKAARINLNLTQDEAAKKIGVSKKTLSSWEQAKSYPNAIQLKKIECTYGVGYNDLIFLPRNYA